MPAAGSVVQRGQSVAVMRVHFGFQVDQAHGKHPPSVLGCQMQRRRLVVVEGVDFIAHALHEQLRHLQLSVLHSDMQGQHAVAVGLQNRLLALLGEQTTCLFDLSCSDRVVEGVALFLFLRLRFLRLCLRCFHQDASTWHNDGEQKRQDQTTHDARAHAHLLAYPRVSPLMFRRFFVFCRQHRIGIRVLHAPISSQSWPQRLLITYATTKISPRNRERTSVGCPCQVQKVFS